MRVAHLILRAALVGVAAVLTGTVLLIFDVVVGRTEALIAAGALLLVVVGIAALPLLLRSSRHYRGR